MKKKFQKIKKEIDEERNKLMSKNVRKIRTTEILSKPKMIREKNIYETDEMVPITEADKFNKAKNNFESQLEKDLNSLCKRYDESLHHNRTLREEIDLINKEKQNFLKMHKN